MRLRSQAGVTLIELMTVVAIAAIAVGVTLAYSLEWLAQETMRSAAMDLQAFLQLTKMEAISRNRPCRFVVDPVARELEVWDSMGTTGDTSDDELLHTRTLPQAVHFARPDSGAEITMDAIGSDGFELTYASDGIVSNGDGAVHVHGGDGFGRVIVYVAGGVAVEFWNGSAWEGS